MKPREERFQGKSSLLPDQRNCFDRDRDRILYSSSFARLGAVTQVVAVGESHLFHNRLTHSMKVAQVGRRMAELILAHQPEYEDILNPAVVEAACLAHDLGHPPFGHVGEKELDRLICAAGDPDGYEGNAQSFRIITRLETRSDSWGGLDLCRATLNAVLKYPWPRDLNPIHNSCDERDRPLECRKWGVYRDDLAAFQWVRESQANRDKSLEAQVMDWADEVTYAVHDLADFFRVGLIPLERMGDDQREFGEFIEHCCQRQQGALKASRETVEEHGRQILSLVAASQPYDSSRESQASLQNRLSQLISYFFAPEFLKVVGGKLNVPEPCRIQAAVLAQLTWRYVIKSPSLALKQEGQRHMLRFLFHSFRKACKEGRYDLFPARWREDLKRSDSERRPRLLADLISSLTEHQVKLFNATIRGVESQGFLDLALGHR